MKTKYWIYVNGSEQTLTLKRAEEVISCYPISTAKRGFGEQNGSEMTPRGWHEIHSKVGGGMAMNSVFIARQPTGEQYTAELAQRCPDRDWILSRILWLNGLEAGKNCGGTVDTYRRYIYIHGAPDSEPLGVPLSHGCIRMANHDVIMLFDQIEQGCPVLIEEGI
ncbi:MAG: L,D-transpeptidase [Gammaproteobacteria bacterium]|nr:L,D-transpeptidase [Gammaproteobacteria bacterium]MCP4476304.1 L,D-transpeptidase [Gammaproteobacteria bacterium]